MAQYRKCYQTIALILMVGSSLVIGSYFLGALFIVAIQSEDLSGIEMILVSAIAAFRLNKIATVTLTISLVAFLFLRHIERVKKWED